MTSRIRCWRAVMSDMIDSLLVVTATLAAAGEGCKHMFGPTLDTEQAFGHARAMHRTHVRRRVTLALVVIGLTAIASGTVAGALRPGREAEAMAPVARRTYVVHEGDTMWSIASRVARGADPRPLVAAIEADNGVRAGELVPGMTLSIPAG